jgi:hypothetical protein
MDNLTQRAYLGLINSLYEKIDKLHNEIGGEREISDTLYEALITHMGAERVYSIACKSKELASVKKFMEETIEDVDLVIGNGK